MSLGLDYQGTRYVRVLDSLENKHFNSSHSVYIMLSEIAINTNQDWTAQIHMINYLKNNLINSTFEQILYSFNPFASKQDITYSEVLMKDCVYFKYFGDG